MKTCTVCNQNLPLEKFSVADSKSGRLRGDCKVCVEEKRILRYADDKEKLAEIRLTANRKYKYGVSREQVLKMLTDQDHSCAICDSVVDYMTAHLDHCHTTSAVRGLLCKDCNWGLGYFRDDIRRLNRAITYLEG